MTRTCLALLALAAAGPGWGGSAPRRDGALVVYQPPRGASAQNPMLSPDGSSVLFTIFHSGYNAGPAGLYRLERAGGSLVAIFDEPDHDSVNLNGGAWSPTRRRIVFSSDRGGAHDLWEIGEDGTRLHRIISHRSAESYLEPCYSPDGEWVVFECRHDLGGRSNRGDLRKVRCSGGPVVQLTGIDRPDTDDRQPVWSPRGDRILFQRRQLGTDAWNLWTMDANGRQPCPITAGGADTDASWSPGADRIVYSTTMGVTDLAHLFVIPAGGGPPTKITGDGDCEDGAPAWSPDGLWIYFESHESRDPESSTRLMRIAAPLPERPLSPAAGLSPATTATPLNQVHRWVYQIQELAVPGRVEELVRSTCDLLVVEPTRTERVASAASFDTRGAVARLKASRASDGWHRKWVLAYLDIGEAEDWRWYWAWSRDWPAGVSRPADWPDFIVTRDPDGWTGCYPVAFWMDDWKRIVLGEGTARQPGERDFRSMLDEVVRDGFDGVYLDWVEAYDDDQVALQARKDGVNPSVEMVKLIRTIKEFGRRMNCDFLVIQQNAPDLAEEHTEILDIVDALAQEHVWYQGDADVDWDDPAGHDLPVDPAETASTLEALRRYLAHGLPVFNCEYAVRHAARADRLSRLHGLRPYCTRTALSRLATTDR